MEGVKVYIANFAGHDYASAEQYGELVFITKGYISFQSLDRLKYSVVESLVDSSPRDYLLLSGTPVICAIAAVAWFHLHKEVRLLIHDKKVKDRIAYREMVLNERNFHHLFAALTEHATERSA